MILRKLNTTTVANSGLVVGTAAILTALAGLFKVVSDPDELVALYLAFQTRSDPTHALAKLVGAGVAVVGALAVALVAAYLGKPSTLSPPATAEAEPPATVAPPTISKETT